MDPIFEIELEDCPVCRGTGAMQDEQGYHTPEERLAAAQRVAQLWNMGKVIHTGVGD